MDRTVIELKNICKSFYGNQVLKNINMQLYPGEALCIAGENGSGKSTMIKIISGAYSHDSGSVLINGKDFKSISPNQSMHEGIQVIYQDFSLFPNLSVAENIGLSHHILQKKKIYNLKACRTIAKASLAKIGIELDLTEPIENLSVAQKQIVAIARAITQETKVIIMDEPTTALTQTEIERLYDIINSLKKSGVAIIFVSHKLDEIFAVCDRIFVIRNGEKVADMNASEFERDKLSFYMTGSQINEQPFEYKDENQNKVFEVKHISCGDYFKDISFAIKSTEILCITGRLGSGRTELAKALFGVYPIFGEIFLKGHSIKIHSVNDAVKNKIAYIPDDRLAEGIFMDISIQENIIASILDKLKRKTGIKDKKKILKVASNWMQILAIKGKLPEYAGSLSGGNQQRVVLAKWLASEPDLLVLNCPTVGVDIKSKSEIHEIIKTLANKGIGILLISDDIGEILSTSNRVLVMNKGKITYELKTSDLTYQALSDKITESID